MFYLTLIWKYKTWVLIGLIVLISSLFQYKQYSTNKQLQNKIIQLIEQNRKLKNKNNEYVVTIDSLTFAFKNYDKVQDTIYISENKKDTISVQSYNYNKEPIKINVLSKTEPLRVSWSLQPITITLNLEEKDKHLIPVVKQVSPSAVSPFIHFESKSSYEVSNEKVNINNYIWDIGLNIYNKKLIINSSCRLGKWRFSGLFDIWGYIDNKVILDNLGIGISYYIF